MDIGGLRAQYHQRVCDRIIRIRSKKSGDYPNADGSSKSSVAVAWGIARRLGCAQNVEKITGQRAGSLFEEVTKEFLEVAFGQLKHLRPGKWEYSTSRTAISSFDQYKHLAHLEEVVKQDETLSSTLGIDYIVAPDIIVARWPVTDDEINHRERVVEERQNPKLTPLRASNHPELYPILHASISCKWTIRSDRSQNTRTEALNLVRNRKGRLPHIVAVTAEPLTTRLSALALGTGDLDCVYHFALDELRDALEEVDNPDQLEMLNMMVAGRRLRDISDLPFDLAT